MGAAKLVHTFFVRSAAPATANVERKIRVGRDVRTVPQGRRPPFDELITPVSCCQDGIGTEFVVMPPGRYRTRTVPLPKALLRRRSSSPCRPTPTTKGIVRRPRR